MQDADDVRLYGTVGAEQMYLDPASCYESHLEPWKDEPNHPERAEIEEWTVHPTRSLLPSVEALMTWISEWTAEYGEVSADFDIVPETNDVRQAAEFFLDHIASKIKWKQADKHVASHWVTWTEDGKPLLDGEPMYVPAGTQSDGPGPEESDTSGAYREGDVTILGDLIEDGETLPLGAQSDGLACAPPDRDC